MRPHLLLVRGLQFSLDAVSDSFSPPRTASSATIRLNGLVCVLFGMVCVLAFGGFVLLLNAPPPLLLVPSLMAYALFTVGGYRLIRGKEPAPGYPGEVSLVRVAVGCFSVIFCVALMFGLGAVVAYVLDWK